MHDACQDNRQQRSAEVRACAREPDDGFHASTHDVIPRQVLRSIGEPGQPGGGLVHFVRLSCCEPKVHNVPWPE